MTDRHKPISRFFADLGFALRNERNSWGAMTRDGVLLRVWEDGLDGDRVLVLGSPKELAKRALKSRGLPERVDHLRVLWSGGIAGYAVIARAKDPTADLRKIVWYDQQNVRAITALHGLPSPSCLGIRQATVSCPHMGRFPQVILKVEKRPLRSLQLHIKRCYLKCVHFWLA
jgi:hypothetical protein